MRPALFVILFLFFAGHPVAAQQIPFDIPVSFFNGHVIDPVERTGAAIAYKTGVKRLAISRIENREGHNDTIGRYRIGYAKGGERLPFDPDFDDHALDLVKYNPDNTIAAIDYSKSRLEGCGYSGYGTVSQRFFERNTYQDAQLLHTIRKYFFSGTKVTTDTTQNAWSFTDYYYTAKGLLDHNTSYALNAEPVKKDTTSIRSTQYVYDRKNRLTAYIALEYEQSLIPADSLHLIPENIADIAIRQMDGWYDTVVQQQFPENKNASDEESYKRYKLLRYRDSADETILSFFKDRINSITTYRYNDEGLVAERVKVSNNYGEGAVKEFFTYDKRKRLTEWIINDISYNKIAWQFTYDKSNRVMQCSKVVYIGNGIFSPVKGILQEECKTYQLSYTEDGKINTVKESAYEDSSSVNSFLVSYTYY